MTTIKVPEGPSKIVGFVYLGMKALLWHWVFYNDIVPGSEWYKILAELFVILTNMFLLLVAITEFRRAAFVDRSIKLGWKPEDR
jgi:hypothetical protein